MLYEETKAVIAETHLSHQDKDLLLAFLHYFSADEQSALRELATSDPYFWVKLLVRINILKIELAHGATELLRRELLDAAKVLSQTSSPSAV